MQSAHHERIKRINALACIGTETSTAHMCAYENRGATRCGIRLRSVSLRYDTAIHSSIWRSSYVALFITVYSELLNYIRDALIICVHYSI